MKKILVVLSGVAMLFASCAQESGLPRPEFPTVNEMTVAAGGSYQINFTAEVGWSVALPAEAQPYATLRYDNYLDTQHSGEAGEHTLYLRVNKGAGSYFNDVVFNVEISMNGYTENLAVCTIPKSTKIINVTGAPNAGFESSVKVDFGKGGHPENSPFATAPNTYTVRHNKGTDAKDANFYVQHDFDLDYNYVVYAINSKGEYVNIADSSNPWLSLVPFGTSGEKHRLYMNYTQGRITESVGYEAFVNIEDRDENVVVSIYYVYNPDAEVVVKTSMGLANPDLAADKGVKLDGSGTTYTLTIPTSDILTEHNAAFALKFEGFTDVFATIPQENLQASYDRESGILSVSVKEGATVEGLTRDSVWEITAVSDNGNVSYTINVLFEWAPKEEFPEDNVE